MFTYFVKTDGFGCTKLIFSNEQKKFLRRKGGLGYLAEVRSAANLALKFRERTFPDLLQR